MRIYFYVKKNSLIIKTPLIERRRIEIDGELNSLVVDLGLVEKIKDDKNRLLTYLKEVVEQEYYIRECYKELVVKEFFDNIDYVVNIFKRG